MKVAIIGSFSCHLECIAYLLEIFKDKNYKEVHIYINTDIYKWIDYYSKYYNFQVFFWERLLVYFQLCPKC